VYAGKIALNKKNKISRKNNEKNLLSIMSEKILNNNNLMNKTNSKTQVFKSKKSLI